MAQAKKGLGSAQLLLCLEACQVLEGARVQVPPRFHWPMEPANDAARETRHVD
jgi:hypothetical protein